MAWLRRILGAIAAGTARPALLAANLGGSSPQHDREDDLHQDAAGGTERPDLPGADGPAAQPAYAREPHDARTDQPAIADGRWKRLEMAWITLERISGTISLLIIGGLGLIGLIAALLFGWVDGAWRWLALAGWMLLAAWQLWLAVWYPPLAWRHARYRVTERGTEIRRGVFWRHIINVPHSRVQHTDVTQGPIQRRLQLGTLLIHTAGTESHTVDLPGLAHDRAMRIRDYLLEEGASHATEHERQADEVRPNTSSAEERAGGLGDDGTDRDRGTEQHERD